MRIDNDDDDDLIPLYLASATEWAQAFLGRALITQQLEYVFSAKPFTGAYPYVSLPFPVTIYPLWYPWPTAMNLPTDLPLAPIQSLDAVSFGSWGSGDTTLDPSAYRCDLDLGRVSFLGGALPGNSDHLKFRFTAGYGDSPASVPSPMIAGVLLLLAHLYENRGDVSVEMPAAARALLVMYRRLTFGG